MGSKAIFQIAQGVCCAFKLSKWKACIGATFRADSHITSVLKYKNGKPKKCFIDLFCKEHKLSGTMTVVKKKKLQSRPQTHLFLTNEILL